jgi:hypothetical protein
VDKINIAIGAVVLVLASLGLTFYFQRDQSNAERDQLHAEVQTLKANNAYLTLPELPISVGFHHALVGHSMVADIRSHADMTVALDVVDVASHGHRNYRLNIGPGLGTHVGPLEHVTFEPGDILTLTHDGYKPLIAQVR